jgi:hypothetical protein
MIRFDVNIDVEPKEAKGESLEVAVTVVAPEPSEMEPAPIVYFGWPGGGYNRRPSAMKLSGMICGRALPRKPL